MSEHPLRALLEPRSMAVVGASAREGTLGRSALRQALIGGLSGPVYPVNPRYERILDVPCYPSFASLPAPVELAVLALGAPATLPAPCDSGGAGAVAYSRTTGAGVPDQGRDRAGRAGAPCVPYTSGGRGRLKATNKHCEGDPLMNPRTYSWPEGHWDWYRHLAFKHGVRAGGFAFLGGQVDKDATGEPQRAGDLPAQTEVVIAHIERVLEAFGSGLREVVSLIAYHAAPPGGEAALVAAIGRHLKEIGAVPAGRGPVLALVPLPCLALPGMMVEIEAIACPGGEGAPVTRECFTFSGAAPLPDTLSHAVRCGDHLWLGAVDAAEPAEGMATLARVLAGAGAGLPDLVKLNAWYRGEGFGGPDWQRLATGLGAALGAAAPVFGALPTPSLDAATPIRLWGWALAEEVARRHAPAAAEWRWPAALPFPRALACGDLVFLGGHPPLDEEGALRHCGDINAQTRLAMAHTRADLAAFGLSLDDMVKQTSFYLGGARAEDIVANQGLRSSYYREPAGASTGVPLPGFGLPGAEIEIETIAMRR